MGGGWAWGGRVSSPVISRRVPTAMSSLVSDSWGFASLCCCSWNGLENEDGCGVGDKRRLGWGEEGLLTLEIVGWSMLSLVERFGAGDSDVYVPRYWCPSPNKKKHCLLDFVLM
jgi:hypothetical protein